MPAVLTLQRDNLLINKFGVKLTEKPVEPKWILFPQNKPHQVTKDEHGFYNISQLPIEEQNYGEINDGVKKILSWHLSENNELILDIHCSEQVNLWDNLWVKNFRSQNSH